MTITKTLFEVYSKDTHEKYQETQKYYIIMKKRL